jgi:TPR repeat protein
MHNRECRRSCREAALSRDEADVAYEATQQLFTRATMKRYQLLVALALAGLLLLILYLRSSWIERAIVKAKLGNVADGLRDLQALASIGDAEAQLLIAIAYDDGWDGKRNGAIAIDYYRRAAAWQLPWEGPWRTAARQLGYKYLTGDSVVVDRQEAERWFRRAGLEGREIEGILRPHRAKPKD